MKNQTMIWCCAAALGVAGPAFAQPLLIDDFEKAANKLGGAGSVYLKDPSSTIAVQTDQDPKSGAKALRLEYNKIAKGGPENSGGWCGYFTPLKFGSRYFDATSYQTLTFWVKGAQGGENFVVGIADRYWDDVGDSVKSEEVGKYLPAGKITTEWQQAAIPLSAFNLDYKELVAIAVCFEGTVFPGGEGKGTVFLDDIALE